MGYRKFTACHKFIYIALLWKRLSGKIINNNNFFFKSFVLSLIAFFSNIGLVLCMSLFPILAYKYGLLWAVASGILFSLFSLLCAVISTHLDSKFEK